MIVYSSMKGFGVLIHAGEVAGKIVLFVQA